MPKVRMNPAAADAMQGRGLGAVLLHRNPAFISFSAAYPSQIVHWPEPNMPTPLGPRFFKASLNFSAMTSKASSHVTGVNSPFLSYLPPVLRNIGLVRRSWPYMIFERK